MDSQFKTDCNTIRLQIDVLCRNVKDLKKAKIDNDAGEAIANLMLCFRHLEDARMRLGKAIQASEDGVSIYYKPTPPQPS